VCVHVFCAIYCAQMNVRLVELLVHECSEHKCDISRQDESLEPDSICEM